MLRNRLLYFLFFLSFHAPAQDSLVRSVVIDTSIVISQNEDGSENWHRVDSSQVKARSFDYAKLDELRRDDDFDFKQPPSVAESLWDRVMFWIGEFFGWIFRGATTTNWGQVFLYTAALGVMAAIVMMLLKVDALRVFYSGADHGSLKYNPLDENIHSLDFDKLIHEALQKKEFRIGVRLTFLYALKLLADRHHLEWKPGKTNHDYILELNDQNLKTGFNELSFYFDYAWYGEFSVSENLYGRVQNIFEDWRKKL